MTTSSPVSTPFISSWKTTTIAYVAQKTAPGDQPGAQHGQVDDEDGDDGGHREGGVAHRLVRRVAGVPAGHLPHRLERQHRAQRDDEEEQHLLDRDPAGQPDAEGAAGVVVPVPLRDRVEHPGHEDDELRQQRQQQPPPAGVDPHPEHQLQRRGHDQAPGQQTRGRSGAPSRAG